MTRVLAVLRPEPGNTVTVARAQAAGFGTIALPLFVVAPLAWTPPDPAAHDALILTSTNALRFGGEGLASLRGLPVFAVGTHTAAAARAAGFAVAVTGASDAAALVALASARGVRRAMHLTGRDRVRPEEPAGATIAVYDSVAVAIDPADLRRLTGTTALLHSPRAARRLAQLADAAGIARHGIALAAFSQAVAIAAGPGWAAIAVAATPDDAALFTAIAHPPAR